MERNKNQYEYNQKVKLNIFTNETFKVNESERKTKYCIYILFQTIVKTS